MSIIIRAQVCSGSAFKNNPTTIDHTVTSEYLANSFFDEKDLAVTNVNYFDGIN